MSRVSSTQIPAASALPARLTPSGPGNISGNRVSTVARQGERLVIASLFPSSRTSETRSGTHNHRCQFCFDWANQLSQNHGLWLWVPAFAGTTRRAFALLVALDL